MKKSIFQKMALLAVCMGIGLSAQGITAQAAGTVYNSPYVQFAPDGQAWMFKQDLPDSRNDFWYEDGETVTTGIQSTVRSLKVGEHYYGGDRAGEIPVGKWEVAHPFARCIHKLTSYPLEFHGYTDFGKKTCGGAYYSGWIAYCADCGEPITPLIYASKEAVSTVNSINTMLDVYYLCPICNHLEQGVGVGKHTCKAISYNRYCVVYQKNSEMTEYEESKVKGSTPDSFHMYNNATEYEGEAVTPNKYLRKNGYKIEGYHFLGWNTKPDGSGTFYMDGAEIYNLSAEEYDDYLGKGIVTLYAQWKKVETNLEIDPNGGSYMGKTENTLLRQQYGTTYTPQESQITPPEGYTVSFDTNGGEELSPVQSTFSFDRWNLVEPANGIFVNGIYRFRGKMNDTDIIEAIYTRNSITLPAPAKGNASFGGWYRDAECTDPVGKAGDEFTPNADTTLYAKWVELVLYSMDNYAANGGKGAVNLSWRQDDGKNKIYKLYQSMDGVNFSQLYSAEDALTPNLLNTTVSYTGQSQIFTVPYTGFYDLTALGAQGGNYGEKKGGKGGSVSGRFYLQKGETLTVTVGGQDGYNGGGTASMYGCGGGSTIISSNRKGTLLIAGGGGGATENGNGNSGGETNKGLLSQLPSLSGNGGENGAAGGGGGFIGGKAGEYILHHHTESCYTDENLTAGESWYKAATSWFSYEGWGEQTHLEADHVCIEHWGREDSHCIQNISSAQFATPHAGTLTFHIITDTTRATDLGTTTVVVKNQAGEYIYTKAFTGEVYGENADPGFVKKPDDPNASYTRKDGDWYHDYCDGWHDGWYWREFSATNYSGYARTWNKHSCEDADGNWTGDDAKAYVSLDFTVPLPEGTTSISMWINQDLWDFGGPTSLTLSNVAVSSRYLSCGYTEGEVVSSKPAYGGSSYINTTYAITSGSDVGIEEGNGQAVIATVSAGYQEALSLDAVPAPDKAAPDAVEEGSVKITDAVKENKIGEAKGESDFQSTEKLSVLVAWERPADNGTAYYHKAESYETGKEALLSTSNITKNTLVSGIAGYRYLVDAQTGTVLNDSTGDFLVETGRSAALTVELTGSVQYLHLAAVDVAENISPTIHIRLDEAKVAWNLYTEPLTISSEIEGTDRENIYPAGEKQWYVRADGKTPFLLSFTGKMDGAAREDYQVNHAVFYAGDTTDLSAQQKSELIIPLTVPLSSDRKLDSTEIIRTAGGEVVFLKEDMYTSAFREARATRLLTDQSYTMDAALHGKTIEVYPSAGADMGEETYWSDITEDKVNGIRLIADGKAPKVTGLDLLTDKSLINRGSQSVTLTLTASDDVSGVGEFKLYIKNTDNYCERTYEATGNAIQVDITEEDYLFAGDFTVTAYAKDNVGNEYQESIDVTEFALEASVSRILEPHEPIFRSGESGILTVKVWGYADKVEVIFPAGMSGQEDALTYSYSYEEKEYEQEENLEFMVPLYGVEDGQCAIIVNAYKNGKCLKKEPELAVLGISGSVLEDVRTRLR